MTDLKAQAELALEAMRSRNRVDHGTPPPVPLRPESPRLDAVSAESLQPAPPPPLQPFIARHPGTCRICRKRIWEGNEEESGEEIVRLPAGGHAHFYCAEEEAEAA